MEPARVLIIDDEPDIRDLLSYAFLAHQINCELAHDSESALFKLMNGQFHAVVCDVMLPHQNGLDLMKLLASQNIFTPFVFTTGSTDTDLMKAALKQGAIDYLEMSHF